MIGERGERTDSGEQITSADAAGPSGKDATVGRIEPLGVVDEEMTIGETASRIGISTSALRFYEEHGLISARRTAGGQRRYARDVLRRVAFIRAAQSVGLKLAEIKESLDDLPDHRAPTKDEWEDFAGQWRPRLDHQIAVLEAIRDKLSACIGCGCQSLDACEIFNPGDKAAKQGPGAQYLLDSD